MGQNFDDYPGFQPKTTWIKHFCPECTYYAVTQFWHLQNDTLRRNDRVQIELLFLAPPAGTIRQQSDGTSIDKVVQKFLIWDSLTPALSTCLFTGWAIVSKSRPVPPNGKILSLSCCLFVLVTLTLFLPAVVMWRSYMGWFRPWPVEIGLRGICTFAPLDKKILSCTNGLKCVFILTSKNCILLTLLLPAMGGISPYMSVTWQQPVGIGLNQLIYLKNPQISWNLDWFLSTDMIRKTYFKIWLLFTEHFDNRTKKYDLRFIYIY